MKFSSLALSLAIVACATMGTWLGVSALAPVQPSRARPGPSTSVRHAVSIAPPHGPSPQSASFDPPQQTVTVHQPQSNKSKINAKSKSNVQTNGNGVSLPLVRAIWYNQAAVLMGSTILAGACVLMSNHGDITGLSHLHWNGAASTFSSFFDWTVTPMRVLQGIVATFPLIALGTAVERSDNRDASHINFSTTNMVIRLFGRRRAPAVEPSTSTSTWHMMLLSLTMALSTGIAEELVFRGYLPTAIAAVSHSIPLVMFLQAAFFAAGHLSPHVSAGENKIIGGLQFANGLWYGIVYLLTGGDLFPCILSHLLYDMHIFSGTWTSVNNQLDYTQLAYPQPLSPTEEARIAAQAGPGLSTESVNFARRFFYAFDYDHQGSLSHADVQRAMSYAFLLDKVKPMPQDVARAFRSALASRERNDDDLPDDRLSASEFIHLLFELKRQSRVR